MANIITSVPKYSESAIRDAKAEMVKKGMERRRATEKNRTAQARREADALRGSSNDALGRPVMVMPAFEFFRLVQKYGEEEVLSDEFIRDYNKRFPELSPNNG